LHQHITINTILPKLFQFILLPNGAYCTDALRNFSVLN